MKKLWFHGLALALGVLGGTGAYGQYPSGYNNFGPSSYPVQNQSILHNLPQVPQAYSAQNMPTHVTTGTNIGPYQFVAAQEQAQGNPAYEQSILQVPQPQPDYNAQTVQGGNVQGGAMGAAPGCQNCGPAPAMNSAPMVDYGYQQMVAPNSSTCGPGPVSQSSGYDVSGYVCNAPAPARVGLFSGMPAQAKPWFFGASALLMNRVDDHVVPLSFQDAAYNPTILDTRDARFGTAGGIEAIVGRYFNCGRNAISATYWGIYPQDESVTRAGNYRSRIPFTYMEMPLTPYSAAGSPVYDWYDNAAAHYLQRSADYHSVEVNLLGFAVGCSARNFNIPTAGTMFSGTRGQCGYCGGAGCGNCAASCGTCATSKYATGPCCLTPPACGSRLNMTWLAGFRYFRFRDNLLYAASFNDTVVNRSPDDLYYEVDTTNDLFGAQIGGRLDYCVGKRVNLYATSRVGVYNNRSTLFTRLGTDVEDAYLDDTRLPANPGNGADYRISSTKNDVAFLSELGTGVGVRMSPKWTGTFGYRAVIASGVATSVGNIAPSFANYSTISNFNNTGTLILHGINAGAIYNY